jgi:uncharacterized membrane protein
VSLVAEPSTRRRGRRWGGPSASRWRLPVDAGEAAVAVRVVYAGIAAYAVLFAFAAVLHFSVFQTGHADLGNMVQAIWNTLHGHFLEVTSVSGHQHDRLGFHVDPFLLVLAPLFWIWSSPLVLVVVQALAVASGALPVFWLARKHLDSPRAAAHFAFAYLLYPAIQFSAFSTGYSFHSVTIAVPLVLFAVWFLDEDRLVAFSVVALLACTTKEEIALAVGCLGIWDAVRKGRRLFALSEYAARLAVTFFDFLWVIPHYSASGVNPFAQRYAAVGGTPGGMAHTLFTDPVAFVHAVATGPKAAYLVLLLAPFLFLSLLEPLLLLGAVPDLAINLFANTTPPLTTERTAPVVAFVVAASIFDAARFKGQAVRLSLVVLVAATLLGFYSPLTVVGGDLKALGSPAVSAKAHAVGLVPAGVPVSATNQLGGHLAERRFLYLFPVVKRARWIVVDVNDRTQRGVKRALARFESQTRWRVLFSSHGVVVLRRVG